ncbi:MAG TPA: adenylate/guanylate cyclase domain-containing protein [Streptosporangiaceae bacterium]
MRHLPILRRPWWAWLCAAGAIALLWFPSWESPLGDASAATWVLVIVSLVAAGWISLGRAAQRGNGTLMLILAVMASATSLQFATWGPWAFIGTILYPLVGVVLGWLLFRWPRDGMQTRPQLWLIRAAFVLVPVLTLAANVTWDPRWGGATGSMWWPVLMPSHELTNWLYTVAQGVEATLVALFVVLMVARIVRASRPERRELIPVGIAAAGSAAFAAAEAVEAITNTDVSDVVNWASNLATLAVPVSFLISVAVRRVQRALAVEALLDPERLGSADAVGRALSRALGDRHLTLALWSAERGRYLLADGTAAPHDPGDAHVVYVASPADGAPLARLGVNPKLAGRTDFVEAVLRAAGTALDNARLQAELRARQREAEQSHKQLDRAEATQQRMTRLLPGGLAERISRDPDAFTTTELLTVTVLMSDIRGYTGIAENTEPAQLAAQLNGHREAMNEAILSHGGTVMQYVGDAVMAVFGAPEPLDGHEARALAAATRMHASQETLNAAWAAQGLKPFGLGIGLSTGQVAAALLGSRERVEYTVVGDTVNLAARLCDAARPAGSIVASAATVHGWPSADGYELLSALHVKGKAATVAAYRWPPTAPGEPVPVAARPAADDGS